jgi:hypothetical protein
VYKNRSVQQRGDPRIIPPLRNRPILCSGPEHWPDEYPTCDGRRQSPVDMDVFDMKLERKVVLYQQISTFFIFIFSLDIRGKFLFVFEGKILATVRNSNYFSLG